MRCHLLRGYNLDLHHDSFPMISLSMFLSHLEEVISYHPPILDCSRIVELFMLWACGPHKLIITFFYLIYEYIYTVATAINYWCHNTISTLDPRPDINAWHQHANPAGMSTLSALVKQLSYVSSIIIADAQTAPMPSGVGLNCRCRL